MLSTTTGRVTAAFGVLTSALIIGMLTALPSNAQADPVTTAFGDAQAKVTLYGGLLVALVISAVILLMGIAWIRKVKGGGS